jgi:RNA polymerase sporulation-specific sigma factor
MFIRADKKHQGEIFLQDTVGQDSEGNEITFMDLLPTDDDEFIESIDRNINAQRLRERISAVLKGRERVIIELRYGLLNGAERTQKEIGKMLGISRSYVSRLEKSALKKLKASMPELTLH